MSGMNDVAKNEIAELIDFLQEAELDGKELQELVGLLTDQGMTEPVRRRVRSVLVRIANKENEDLERYERALDIVTTHDENVEKIIHEAEQSLNRIDMETNATLDVLQRKIGEDVDAAKGGATLLLHTEDVDASAATPPITPAAVVPTSEPATTSTPMPAMSPKESVALAMASARAPQTPVSPTSSPAYSTPPSYPSNQPLPATMAPLPPTPIAPPAVTEPN